MAVINNLKASLLSFTVNNESKNLINNTGIYGTGEILNGGELLENELCYTFRITGLQGHTISSIDIKSLLLTNDGGLNTSKNLKLILDSYGNQFVGNFIVNNNNKTIITTSFSEILELDNNEFILKLTITMNSSESCYYGLQGIVINLSDIEYSILLSFSGPISSRTPSSISVAVLLIAKGSVAVTFGKDPTSNFDNSIDNVEGRIYFKKDGIYIDGTQYGTVVQATNTKSGLVKILNSFETFTDEETEETGILAPIEEGIAASTILVYNTIQTLKTYTDELVGGVPVPSIELDDNTIEEIDEDYTFSNDFKKADGKIYINWLEI